MNRIVEALPVINYAGCDFKPESCVLGCDVCGEFFTYNYPIETTLSLEDEMHCPYCDKVGNFFIDSINFSRLCEHRYEGLSTIYCDNSIDANIIDKILAKQQRRLNEKS